MENKRATSVVVTCSIGQDLRQQQQESGLSPSECLKKGISIALKEKVWEKNVWVKLREMAQSLHDLTERNTKLAERLRILYKKHGELNLK